jgi:TetR/AcrR family transcriptional repressor of nem operon
MGHSQADKAQSHDRILAVAARQIREQGFDAVSVADLMRQAGLTHGGFYSHFASRDKLIAEAMEWALAAGERRSAKAARRAGKRSLKTTIKAYLSQAHRDAPGSGCAIAALAGELGHAGPDVRDILTKYLRRSFEGIARELGDNGDGWQRALSTMSTMVGALALARAVSDRQLSDEILEAARRALIPLTPD